MAEEFNGKYFSIADPQGVNTVIYRVNKTAKELTSQYPKYTVERLVSSEAINGNVKKKTFFVDYPEPTGEDLVILSFAKDSKSTWWSPSLSHIDINSFFMYLR